MLGAIESPRLPSSRSLRFSTQQRSPDQAGHRGSVDHGSRNLEAGMAQLLAGASQ